MVKKQDLQIGRAVPASTPEPIKRAVVMAKDMAKAAMDVGPGTHACIHNRIVHVIKAQDETLFFLACKCGNVTVKLEDKGKDHDTQ